MIYIKKKKHQRLWNWRSKYLQFVTSVLGLIKKLINCFYWLAEQRSYLWCNDFQFLLLVPFIVLVTKPMWSFLSCKTFVIQTPPTTLLKIQLLTSVRSNSVSEHGIVFTFTRYVQEYLSELYIIYFYVRKLQNWRNWFHLGKTWSLNCKW